MKNLSFFGLNVSNFSLKELDDFIISSFKSNKTLIYYGYSIGLFPKLKKNPNLIEICNSFNLMVTDGRMFYLFVKALGYKIKYDISIPNLTIKTLELANEFSKSVLLFGSTSKINSLATTNLSKTYPKITFFEGIDGYQDLKNEKLLIKKINSRSPDILLIGMHSPFKEEFSFKNKNHLNCKIIIPCGGMIDVFSGYKKLTPLWIKKNGFAWLYRFIQNPISRFNLTSTYLYYFIFKLIPLIIAVRLFNKKPNKSLIDIL